MIIDKQKVSLLCKSFPCVADGTNGLHSNLTVLPNSVCHWLLRLVLFRVLLSSLICFGNRVGRFGRHLSRVWYDRLIVIVIALFLARTF
jgi:hypothetical protein